MLVSDYYYVDKKFDFGLGIVICHIYVNVECCVSYRIPVFMQVDTRKSSYR